jgi:pilus assembly protein CpaE
MSTKKPSLHALLRTPEAAAAVSAAVAGAMDVEATVRVGGIAELGAGASAAAILLVDLDLAKAGEIAELTRLVEQRRGEGVVLVTSATPGVDGVRALLRLGIHDLVPQPFQAGELRAAVANALAVWAQLGKEKVAPARARCILPVIRASGGAGASTIAVNLACSLATEGKRVCLLDLDLQFGSCSILLDLTPHQTLQSLSESAERLDGTLFRSALIEHRSGVRVLPASDAMQPYDLVTPEFAAKLLDIAAAEFDCVVVDMPGAWTAWTRDVLAAAEAILLVCQLTVPSVRLCRRQIETLEAEGLAHIPLATVLNRHDIGLFGKQEKLKDAERVIGRQFDHVIPSDYQSVSTAIDLGGSLQETGKASKIRKRIDGIKAFLAASHSAARPA